MPPKKKNNASNGVDESDLILHYMKRQNRPYSAIDVFNNLHGQVGKTAVTKILTQLVASGELTAKTYGKQSVYVIRQDDQALASPEELNLLDEKLMTQKQHLTALKDQVKTLTQTLQGLQSALTVEELKERLVSLEAENARYAQRLNDLNKGERKVDPLIKKRIDEQYALYTKAWQTRKKMCMNIVNTLTEGNGLKPKIFMEQVGLELDP